MKSLKFLKDVLLILIFILIGSLLTRVFYKPQVHYIPSSSPEWTKLDLILSQVDANYVDALDYEKIIENAIPNILKNLDPHSFYLPPVEKKEADEDLQGNFEGIGIVFNVPADTAIIINVVPGGPSEKAGLISGDRIIKLNHKLVAGVKIAQDSLIKIMRGPSGSKLDMEVLRSGEKVPFQITRDKIPVNSIDVSYMVNDTTAYIKLAKFSRTSHKEFQEHSKKIIALGAKKIIFDLRGNTGGYLDQALLLANEFLAEGDLIVYMQGRARKRQDFFADGKGTCKDIDLAVLIDEGSASSSEIFAGAIQDNDRGIIYGRRSFGKGLVQEPINFSDGSGIRLTVARFYTPSGRSIQKPYVTSEGESYEYDIIERYRHGEMSQKDSIHVVDSLAFTTKNGRVVYGGGGITPDVFVPIDTVGVTDLLVTINRQSHQMKFSIAMADKYRSQLRKIKNLDELYSFYNKIDLESQYISYLKKNGVKVPQDQWNRSKTFIITQLEALIGRYSPLDDNAFYPIISKIDNVMEVVINQIDI